MSLKSTEVNNLNGQERIIDIFLKLLYGEKLTKKELATNYSVNIRTIQRDLSILKYQLEYHTNNLVLCYEKNTKKYFFQRKQTLDHRDVLIISKVLLESRALTKKEISHLIYQLIDKLDEKNRLKIKQLIANELLLYQPLSHNKDLIELIWAFSNFIQHNQAIEFSYRKQNGDIVQRTALPVSIFFSEYYFYILCYNPKYEKYLSYRLDRFIDFHKSSLNIHIEYKNRIQEGELRKRIHFMYTGREITFTFQYQGTTEAALDRLPDSTIVKDLKDEGVIIEAKAYDRGVKMWLLSQGSNVKVLSPPSFVEEMKQEIRRMQHMYES